MAAVTPDERRILMDFFGVPSESIDEMSETKAMRGLEQYHAAGKLSIYDASPPLPSAVDWISDGLARSFTPEGIEFGFRESGKVIETTARQVGVGIQKAAAEATSTLKIIALAVVVIGIGLAYVKLR